MRIRTSFGGLVITFIPKLHHCPSRSASVHLASKNEYSLVKTSASYERSWDVSTGPIQDSEGWQTYALGENLERKRRCNCWQNCRRYVWIACLETSRIDSNRRLCCVCVKLTICAFQGKYRAYTSICAFWVLRCGCILRRWADLRSLAPDYKFGHLI